MHLNSILILPAELIVNILKYTDHKTVIACRSVGLSASSRVPLVRPALSASLVVPPPQGHSGRLLRAPIHRRTGSSRDVRRRPERFGPRGAVVEITGDAERVEAPRVVDRRSLPVLERNVAVPHNGVGKSGRVPQL